MVYIPKRLHHVNALNSSRYCSPPFYGWWEEVRRRQKEEITWHIYGRAFYTALIRDIVSKVYTNSPLLSLI